VEDRRRDAQGCKLRFSSKILPPYLRKTKSIEELIPWLYLKASPRATSPRPSRRSWGRTARSIGDHDRSP